MGEQSTPAVLRMMAPVRKTTTQHKEVQKEHPQAALGKVQTRPWGVMITAVMNMKTVKMMKRRTGKPVLKMKLVTA